MVLWGQLHCLVFQCNTIPEETSFLDSLFADKQHDLLSKKQQFHMETDITSV